jgi:hypothetical protein
MLSAAQHIATLHAALPGSLAEILQVSKLAELQAFYPRVYEVYRMVYNLICCYRC